MWRMKMSGSMSTTDLHSAVSLLDVQNRSPSTQKIQETVSRYLRFRDLPLMEDDEISILRHARDGGSNKHVKPNCPKLQTVKFDLFLQVICNNETCSVSWMHGVCFAEFEQHVLSYLRSCGRARSWSEKQRLQNLWTKKGYDLAYKACDCKCGKGHLRKDNDYIAPPKQGGKQRKHRRKMEKGLPTLQQQKVLGHNSLVAGEFDPKLFASFTVFHFRCRPKTPKIQHGFGAKLSVC